MAPIWMRFKEKQPEPRHAQPSLGASLLGAFRSIALATVTVITLAHIASAQRIVTGESVDALRQADGVRVLQPLEEGKPITSLPNGVYGFAVPWIINTDSAGVVGGTGPDRIRLRPSAFGTSVMEIHKLPDGGVYVIGYVSKDDLARLQAPSTNSGTEATIFFTPYQEYSVPVAIPLSAIQTASERKVERHYVSDLLVNLGHKVPLRDPSAPKGSGTGFFITDDGYLVSNYHVVSGAARIRVVTGGTTIDAKVVRLDEANDLALLKVEGQFTGLPVLSSQGVRLGATVATVGFPDPTLQGFSPKLTKGEISSLSGWRDNPRYYQISVPVQPGNSGGALVDEHGNVVGIVSAILNPRAALAATGTLPQNVNYAVKSSFLLSFLESVPEVSAKLKEPATKEESFEDVVKLVQAASVRVEIY